MNNVFSLSRFCRLFVKHTAEHYKSYLMSLAVLIGVMLLGGSFVTYLIPYGFMDVGLQSILFVAIMLLAGTIFTSTIFTDLGDNKKAVAYLTLPASHFEKYLVAWLYTFVIFIIVFTGSFYLILSILINAKHFAGQKPKMFNVFENNGEMDVFLLFLLFQSISFYGAVLFKKLHFIKTAFSFFICMGVFIIINKITLDVLLGQSVVPTMPFSNVRFIQAKSEVLINIGLRQDNYGFYLISALAIIFWVAAYYRLKEKQV